MFLKRSKNFFLKRKRLNEKKKQLADAEEMDLRLQNNSKQLTGTDYKISKQRNSFIELKNKFIQVMENVKDNAQQIIANKELYKKNYGISVNSDFTIENFMPNYISNYASLFTDTTRNRTMMALYIEYSRSICFTAGRTHLFSMMYDCNWMYKKVIDDPISFSFSSLKFNVDKQTDLKQDEQNEIDNILSKNKNTFINVVTQAEIRGCCFIEKKEKEENNYDCIKIVQQQTTDKTQAIYPIHKAKNPLWSGGLSFYEDKIELLKQLDDLYDRFYKSLKILSLVAKKDNNISDVNVNAKFTTGEQKKAMDEDNKVLATELLEDIIVFLRPNEDIIFPRSVGDVSKTFIDALCWVLQQATEGIPAGVFRGESLASITIGNKENDEKPLLKQLKDKFRSNYYPLICSLQKEMQKFIEAKTKLKVKVSHSFDDTITEEMAQKYNVYNNIVNLMSNISNAQINENFSDIARDILEKMKQDIK